MLNYHSLNPSRVLIIEIVLTCSYSQVMGFSNWWRLANEIHWLKNKEIFSHSQQLQVAVSSFYLLSAKF